MDGPCGRGFPDDGRAALTAETECLHPWGHGSAEDRPRDLADGAEEGLGIVLHQPRAGVGGKHLAVRLPAWPPGRIEEEGPDPGCPHVEGEYRAFAGPLTHRLRF